VIVGAFDTRGRSYVRCLVSIPRLGVVGDVTFRIDTGADSTYLHPDDGIDMGIPFERLENPVRSRGIGGTSQYFLEEADLIFDNDGEPEARQVDLRIAKPDGANEGLPSLLGLNVINHWYMEYDPVNGRLEFTVR
jgi:hypothetical protein